MNGAIATENQLTKQWANSDATSSLALRLRCPVCSAGLAAIDFTSTPSPIRCAGCGFAFANERGIWGALPDGRKEQFRQFISEYARVRQQEGRGSTNPDFYLSLPYRDLNGWNSWQWRIRARSFVCFEKKILPQIERSYSRALRILDIGAGNCWLSYRMALRGHFPVAVDLMDNDTDGLGAARHYFLRLPRPFPRFQAEMDRLPFAAGQLDVAIFNASFHYSEDFGRTLSETLRCLARPAHVVIIDSPFYHKDRNGQVMVAEKHKRFEAQYGFRSDSVRSREYLTQDTLDQLASICGLRWRTIKPRHGLAWALRPWRARLLRQREPAKFFIFWATVEN